MPETEPTDRSGGEAVEAAPGIVLPKTILNFDFARSAGPGGQNVNKVNTAVTLRVRVDDLRVHANLSDRAVKRLEDLAGSRLTKEGEIILRARSTRSQWTNRQRAIERLGELIAKARAVPRKRKKTTPSRGAKERRLQQKRERSEKKHRRNWDGRRE